MPGTVVLCSIRGFLSRLSLIRSAWLQRRKRQTTDLSGPLFPVGSVALLNNSLSFTKAIRCCFGAMTIASFLMNEIFPPVPIALPLARWTQDSTWYRAFHYDFDERFTETSQWIYTDHDIAALMNGRLAGYFVLSFGRSWCPVLFFPCEWPPAVVQDYLDANDLPQSFVF